MTKTKRFLVLVLIVTLLINLVGCSSNTNSDASQDAKNISTPNQDNAPKITNLNDIHAEDGNKFEHLGIVRSKWIDKETTDKELIKSLWSDINNLKLSVSNDTNIPSDVDYWLKFSISMELLEDKSACTIMYNDNKLIINETVYDIKEGSVDFKRYYDMIEGNRIP